jgi:hypothetical protein
MYWPRELKGQCCFYWSSSPVADFGGNAWLVSFGSGGVNYGVPGGNGVRCVR